MRNFGRLIVLLWPLALALSLGWLLGGSYLRAQRAAAVTLVGEPRGEGMAARMAEASLIFPEHDKRAMQAVLRARAYSTNSDKPGVYDNAPRGGRWEGDAWWRKAAFDVVAKADAMIFGDSTPRSWDIAALWWPALWISATLIVLIMSCRIFKGSGAAAIASWGCLAATLCWGSWCWPGKPGTFASPGKPTRHEPNIGGISIGSVTEAEARALVERDLARWLGRHSEARGTTVVFSAPELGSALAYYGELRVVASLREGPSAEEGRQAAAQLARAASPEEARTLLEARQVTQIILPSWTPFFSEEAKTHADSFARWLLTGHVQYWLRARAYRLPKIGGFEGQTVSILDVVPEQSRALATGRFVEYLLDMEQAEAAQSFREELEGFPGDVGALTALARLAAARGDASGFQSKVSSLKARLAREGDRGLAWDRRVSLAGVLALAQDKEACQGQLLRCLKSVDERKLKSLDGDAISTLVTLADEFKMAFPSRQLEELARALVNTE